MFYCIEGPDLDKFDFNTAAMIRVKIKEFTDDKMSISLSK